MIVIFFIILIGLFIISYGYIDPNLVLTKNPAIFTIFKQLTYLAYQQRAVSTLIFSALLFGLFVCYGVFFRYGLQLFQTWKRLCIVLCLSAALLACSYPALTYDLFNYIITAKVTFTYHENPYVVMPVEIHNEPYLAFTRAANKVALYGPVWLVLTAIPHALGNGNIWQTIIAFKLMNALAYIGFSYLIYRVTKNLTNVIFFALNPLVLIEVLMNGHNDIYMMILALGGLILWQQINRMSGLVLFVASWFIKGATVILAPLIFFRKLSWEQTLMWSYGFLAVAFFIFAPLREELYPWYAVWLIMTASLLPIKKHPYIIWFTIILSFALELRNLPYMWMGYYGGPGPALRFGFTILPIVLYAVYAGFAYFRKRHT